MGIVAKERGGLAPCIGGPHRIGGVELVKVLSFNDVRGIVSLFDRLNPYDRRLVPHILKIEKMQPGLNGYAISTKRYALYSRELGSLRIEKASEHGLGYLFPPKHGFNEYTHAPEWIEELWQHILREAESLPLRNPSWFDAPAMMRFTVTTPQVLRPLQRLQTRMPYRRRTKPYNFVLSPILNRFVMAALQEPITLITPFTTDPCQLARQQWINIHDGKIFRQISIPVETFGDVARDFRFHKESKSCGPDGKPCDFDTRGLLKRTHVTACATIAHGKETDRQWQHGGDFSLLFPLLPVYRPHETEKMVSDPILPSKARGSSIRDLATKTGLSTRTIRSARNGKRLRKSTIRKIEEAVSGG
jgi:hypothetical protein